MLVSLYIKNFGPVGKKPFLFSMETQNKGKTNADKEYTFSTKFPDHPYLMKAAGIFGPNASGKSTVFKAIKCMEYIISNSHKFDSDDNLPDETFKLSSLKDGYSEIEIRFIQSDTLYEYGITFSKEKIAQEIFRSKYADNDNKWHTIIDRKKNTLHSDILPFIEIDGLLKDGFMDDKDGYNHLCKTVFWSDLKENQLALSEIMHKKECKYFDDFMYFFKSMKMFEGDKVPWSYGVGDFEKKKNITMDLLNEADFGVSDIKFITEDILQDNQSPKFLTELLNNKDIQKILEEKPNAEISAPFMDGMLLKITKDKVEIQTVNITVNKGKHEHTFQLSELSSGTNSFFGYATTLNNILEKGAILFIDEIERSLHPYLTNYIVNLFNDEDSNPKNAQLIFISHDVSLLDRRTLNPEQVYFTDKDYDTLQSDLYSLAEFGLKPDRDSDYGKKYLKGIFGAIPNIA